MHEVASTPYRAAILNKNHQELLNNTYCVTLMRDYKQEIVKMQCQKANKIISCYLQDGFLTLNPTNYVHLPSINPLFILMHPPTTSS